MLLWLEYLSVCCWQAPGRISNDLGALCPQLDKPEQGLDLLQEAITSLGLNPGVDFHLVLNCAAHEVFDFVSYLVSCKQKFYTRCNHVVYLSLGLRGWHSGTTSMESDLQFIGGSNLRQIVYTSMPLSPSSIIETGQRMMMCCDGKVTAGLAGMLEAITRFIINVTYRLSA